MLGLSPGGKPDRFRVTIDGAASGLYHGVDVKTGGAGVLADERLYRPVRRRGAIADRIFRIRFPDPGVEAYAFTFG